MHGEMSPQARITLDELERLPMEAAMGADHLVRLASIGDVEQIPAGATVFQEGGPADALRIVVSGRVALLIDIPGAQPSLVGTVGRGDLLGWSALRGNARWATTARATKPSRCLRFPADPLRALCDSDHELGYHMMRHAFLDLAQRHTDLRMQLLDVYGRR
jgi:CRP/FNR family transcriptional regulator, cyclic AMP receptor protein